MEYYNQANEDWFDTMNRLLEAIPHTRKQEYGSEFLQAVINHYYKPLNYMSHVN